ncbi:MAG: endolytic transglycosylase MltG [Betaproteobacteria bacterium]|nr:endolytic transglycosylase MltG [Betaproteobacteria bacterium]
MRLRWLLFFVAATGILAGASVYGLRWLGTQPLMEAGAPIRITIDQGMGLRAIARQLHRQGLVAHPLLFVGVARLHGKAERLKAGVYEIRPGMSARSFMEAMVRGDSIREQIRFIEGWNFKQIRAAVDAHPGLKHDTRQWTVSALLERIGAIEKGPEGLFFPDSYQFASGSSDLVVWRQAYAQMRSMIERTWRERQPGIPVATPYEALILASIVEKETGSPSDRPQIAAVFSNRLRIGMRLQSDPTVIYGMGASFDGNLRRADLEQDTPYNTYVRPGLPPTPIASPGAAALEAVMRPPASRALYFVARGDGSSEFSESLSDHNRAVDRFQRRSP